MNIYHLPSSIARYSTRKTTITKGKWGRMKESKTYYSEIVDDNIYECLLSIILKM